MAGRWPVGYVFQAFPKCLYHGDGRVRVVANAGEELALGPEWAEKPPPPAEVAGDASVAPPTLEHVPRRRGRPRKTG